MNRRLRETASTLVLLALPSSMVACGPGHVALDDGSEPAVHTNEPLPPLEPGEGCDDPELLIPFGERGPLTRMEGQSRCGHLLTWYFDGEFRNWTLWYPDGHTDSLGTAPVPSSDVFSPTGRLLAWAEGEEEDPIHRVRTLDLQTGETWETETQGVATFGFVRVDDSDRGASLWMCDDDVLSLVDPEFEDQSVLVEDVRCDTVAGAELTTRLVYADLDDVLSVVDARDGTHWSTSVSGIRLPTLSPDGSLAFDGGETPPYRVVDLDRGEPVTSCEFLEFEQALVSAAPLFFICDHRLDVWRDGVLEQVRDDIQNGALEPTSDGSAFFEIGDQLWFAPAQNPTDARFVIAFENSWGDMSSPDGQYGWEAARPGTCADVDCSDTIVEMRPWTPEGLGTTIFVTGWFLLLHVFDDGHALAFGAPIEGPLPEGTPIPPDQLFIGRPDGTLANSWSITGHATGFPKPLDDGRLILHTSANSSGHVFVFDREVSGDEALQLFAGTNLGMHVDPRLGLVGVLREIGDSGALLWGAVPD